jgi:hypothetical protein
MGKHARPRRGARFTRRPSTLVEWVDLRTGVTHLLTLAAISAGRDGHWHYVALCGVEVLPGDSAEPQGDCQACRGRSLPAQRSTMPRSPRTSSPPAPRWAHLTGIVDAQTQVEHWVTDRSAAEHRHSGRYLALCGVEVLARSLTAPARGRCMVCVDAS